MRVRVAARPCTTFAAHCKLLIFLRGSSLRPCTVLCFTAPFCKTNSTAVAPEQERSITHLDQQLGRIRPAIRAIVTVLAFLSFAFAFYSIVVPIWAYGILFGDQPNKVSFFGYGIGAPLRDFPIRTLIVLGPLIVALIVSLSNRRASGFFARRSALVVVASATVVVITAGLVRWRVKAPYEAAVQLRSDAQFARSFGGDIRKSAEVLSVGQVPDTAYFL
jgi:hypothetical protein